MKDESKSKAKAPAAKRASKSAAKSKKIVGASKGAGAGTKKTALKAKTPAAKTKATKAKPAEKSPAKRKKPAAETKSPTAKTRKRAAKVGEATDFRIGEPVLDPIGDVISGEARTYLGGAETAAQAERGSSGSATVTAAQDATLEAGPGMAAARAASESGVEEEETGGETYAGAQAPAQLERLQKILSRAGIASRRRAEEMIVAGRVMVNGQVVTQLGSKADTARDHIRVDGKLLQGAERHRYFVLNKPRGYVTTVSDPEGRPTVMEFFAKMHERLYPVGRLDYLSEGLLLMTNDGELANLLTKAGSGVEKIYLVKVAGQPSEEELERLRGGVAIERGEAGSERVRTAPARIRQVRVGENPWYEVVLTEGRNRELRKMFAAIGHFAEKIRRVGYGPLVLDLEPGKLRELTADEVNALRLTAEGKMKPRRARTDLTLPKEAGRDAEKRGERPARPWRDRTSGKRFHVAQGGAQGRGGKPFRQREERGQRTEWKPREREFANRGEGKPFRREEKTGFGVRGGTPTRASSAFDKRQGKSFDARPEFGGRPRGQAAGRFENSPRKPFRAHSERPFFKQGEGSKKHIEGERSVGFDRRPGKKKNWTQKPGRWRNAKQGGADGWCGAICPGVSRKALGGKGREGRDGTAKASFRSGAGGVREAGQAERVCEAGQARRRKSKRGAVWPQAAWGPEAWLAIGD